MTELRRPEVVVGGVRSPVLEGGGRGEEAVVFVHGNPGSGEDWRDLAQRMAPLAPVLAPDMPGFGKADKPSHFDYTVGGYSRHLGALLDARGIRRAHLVAHDFGGSWALAWAAQHPEAIASVVLVNTGVLVGYRWHRLARIWRTPVLGELSMALSSRAGFHLVLRRGNPGSLPRAFVDRMYDDFDAATRRAVLHLYRATSDSSAASEQLRSRLLPLDLPALVVWGRHDAYIPFVYAERQRETFPSAEVVVLDGSGHWPFIDDPETVATAVVPFLRRQLDRTDDGGRGRAG